MNFLELDHRDLVAHGGQPTVGNLRYLCRAHNQYEAERVLGHDFVEGKRAARKAAAKASGGANAPAGTFGDANTILAEAGCAIAEEAKVGCANGSPAEAGGAKVAEAKVDGASRKQGAGQADASAARRFDGDVTLALRSLGFKSAEARRAIADSAHLPASTLEQRLRAALVAAARARESRCSEGFDLAWTYTGAWRTDSLSLGCPS